MLTLRKHELEVLLLRLLRTLLVVLLMMLGFTYFRRALVWFVRFDFFALGRRGQDERRWILGAVGCAFSSVGKLAAQLETEVSKDQAIIFITDLSEMEEPMVKSEV